MRYRGRHKVQVSSRRKWSPVYTLRLHFVAPPDHWHPPNHWHPWSLLSKFIEKQISHWQPVHFRCTEDYATYIFDSKKHLDYVLAKTTVFLALFLQNKKFNFSRTLQNSPLHHRRPKITSHQWVKLGRIEIYHQKLFHRNDLRICAYETKSF